MGSISGWEPNPTPEEIEREEKRIRLANEDFRSRIHAAVDAWMNDGVYKHGTEKLVLEMAHAYSGSEWRTTVRVTREQSAEASISDMDFKAANKNSRG